MNLNTYLLFNGDCEEAFKFYERTLGGKIEFLMTHANSPQPQESFPAEWGNKVMHACLVAGENVLMGSDIPPSCYEKPAGFSISLKLKDVADAERTFSALAENGAVKMPLQETFWAHRFGMLVDRYGVPWMVNCERTFAQIASHIAEPVTASHS